MLKSLLEKLQELSKELNLDSMEDETGVNEIAEDLAEKPAKMEKAKYKTTKINKPEVDTVAGKLLKQCEDVNDYATEQDVEDGKISEDEYLDTFEYIYLTKVNGNLADYKQKLKDLKADHKLLDYEEWCKELGYNPEIAKYFQESLTSILSTELDLCEDMDLLSKDDTFRYMMLDRLKTDCNYFLGNGNRNEKHLWAGDVDEQIKLMKDLYNSFEEKPEWISMEDIENFEKQMKETNESLNEENWDEIYTNFLKDLPQTLKSTFEDISETDGIVYINDEGFPDNTIFIEPIEDSTQEIKIGVLDDFNEEIDSVILELNNFDEEDVKNIEQQVREFIDNIMNDIYESVNESLNEEGDLTWEQVEPQVKEAVEAYKKQYDYLFKDGSFELYVDYNDNLDESTIKEIFESDAPKDAFYDIIGGWDWYDDAWEEYKEILKNLKLDEDIKEGFRDEIMDYLQENVSYSIPFDHFDENVNFDIFIHDAEEANKEYTGMLSYTETDETDEDGDYIKEVDGVNPMLEKLLVSQGYTAEQFIEYFNKGEKGDTFLDSVVEEINNCTYDYGNQIVFLVNAPITEMAGAIQNGGTLTIPADAMCGFVNCGNGSGSVLEIKLKQPFTGKLRDMKKPAYQDNSGDLEAFYYDGYRYNVDEIYGLVNDAWEAKVTIQPATAQQESLNEISAETASITNTFRNIDAHTKEAKAKQTGDPADKAAAEKANKKAAKNNELYKKWKKAKGLEESKKSNIVAVFTENNNTHEIVRNSKGNYNIRYNVVEGKARFTKAGVKSLPVAVDSLKKRFPEAKEVKSIKETKLNELNITRDEVEQKRKDILKKAQDNAKLAKEKFLAAKDNYEAPGPIDPKAEKDMEAAYKEYLDAEKAIEKPRNKFIKTAMKNIKK